MSNRLKKQFEQMAKHIPKNGEINLVKRIFFAGIMAYAYELRQISTKQCSFEEKARAMQALYDEIGDWEI